MLELQILQSKTVENCKHVAWLTKQTWRTGTAVDNTEVAYSDETLIPIQQYTAALYF